MSDIHALRAAAAPSNFEALLRNARLASGLVLMVFVVTHLANHALNLISLETAEAGRLVFLRVWRSPPATVLLYGSLLVHFVLALVALYRRRTLVMPPREAAQVILGLLIPLLVAEHVVGTRLLHALYDLRDTYEFVVRSLWVWTPAVGVRQAIALVVIWAHGCLGIYFWLRYRRWYSRAAPWLLIVAVLLPVLALLGFAHAGQTIAAMGQPTGDAIDPALFDEAIATKERIDQAVYFGFVAIVAAVLIARLVRDRIERLNLIEVDYPGGQAVRIPKGYSVLDASRLGGIPHYSVCGGRGRCSTCRVKVIEGLEGQPEAGQIEQATLHRIAAEGDVRLACQFKPIDDVRVMPLLVPRSEQDQPVAIRSAAPGREQVVAVLFCDMRNFTSIADQRLPFDIVFLLNRYFAIVGEAVEKAGGRLDKFIGDGAMALFGLQSPPGEACRQALAAARVIVAGTARLSDELAGELSSPVHVAIGIHIGPAIVGSMGFGNTMGVTAIGDTVNISSRLEAAAKEFSADLVISEAAAKLSGLDFLAVEQREIDIRGRARPLGVYVVGRGVPIPNERSAVT
jgi:adenylate cyclase